MARTNEVIKKIDKLIGIKIAELRRVRGLSCSQLAKLIDVSHQQLQKYEQGINRISVGRLKIIASSLRSPMQYFFDDDEVYEGNAEQRLTLELARIFVKLKDTKQKVALVALARTLH